MYLIKIISFASKAKQKHIIGKNKKKQKQRQGGFFYFMLQGNKRLYKEGTQEN